MARKKALEVDWRDIGAQMKVAHEELESLTLMLAEPLPAVYAERAIKVLEQLDRLALDVENEMFRRGGPRDLSIFGSELGGEGRTGS